MGRKKLWAENINLTLPEGAKAKMDSMLEDGEDRLELIRSAIDREIKRRERKLRLSEPAGDQDEIPWPE